MEPFRTDSNKLAEMIMCGDHSSLPSKVDLNAKETTDAKDKAKDKDRRYPSNVYGKMTPTASRIAALPCGSEHELKSRTPPCARNQQSHVLRAAALRGVRWAPYQLVGWALLLLAAHALAGLVELLERAMPPLRGLCEYLSELASSLWRSQEKHFYAAAVGGAAGTLWVAYGALRVSRALALWALLPVCDGPAESSLSGPTVHEIDSRLNSSLDR